MDTIKKEKKNRKPVSSHDCCKPEKNNNHPDHSEFLPRLNRIKGQISGVEKMITDNRYCVDILIQFRAVMAALRSIEVNVFETHLKHCVNAALLSKDEKEVAAKIKELTDLLARRTSI